MHSISRNLFAFIILCMAGCAAPSAIPVQSDARAGLSRSWAQAQLAKGNVKEEISPAIRAEILEAIRDYMMAVGRYPSRAVETSELLTLFPAKAPNLSANTRWSYLALVQVNLEPGGSQKIEFSVLDRAGTVVVRKTSM